MLRKKSSNQPKAKKSKKKDTHPIELTLKRCYPDIHHFDIPLYQYSQCFSFYGSNLDHLQPGTKILMRRQYNKSTSFANPAKSSIMFTVLQNTTASHVREGDKMIALPKGTSRMLMYYQFL